MDPDIVGYAVAWGVDFAHDAGGLVVRNEGLTLLPFFKTVASEEEVAGADGVVDTAGELADVVVDQVESVVVVAIGASDGAGRQRKSAVDQGHGSRIEEGGDVAIVERRAVVTDGGRRVEGAVVAAGDVGAEIVGECGSTEVARAHGFGGDEGVNDGAARAAVGVDIALRVIFCASEEG